MSAAMKSWNMALRRTHSASPTDPDRWLQGILQDARRQIAKGEHPLDDDQVFHVEREPGVVSQPAHEFVSEQQCHERQPIGEHQPATNQHQQQHEPHRDRDHVRRDRQAALDHQGSDQERVAGYSDE